jgi:hypothetical protein
MSSRKSSPSKKQRAKSIGHGAKEHHKNNYFWTRVLPCRTHGLHGFKITKWTDRFKTSCGGLLRKKISKLVSSLKNPHTGLDAVATRPLTA